jgi:hypothetical protein
VWFTTLDSLDLRKMHMRTEVQSKHILRVSFAQRGKEQSNPILLVVMSMSSSFQQFFELLASKSLFGWVVNPQPGSSRPTSPCLDCCIAHLAWLGLCKTDPLAWLRRHARNRRTSWARLRLAGCTGGGTGQTGSAGASPAPPGHRI